MFRKCNCGLYMEMELRRLVYARKACICHVPVYTCRVCSTYELMPLVKPDLIAFIKSLGEVNTGIEVSFADINEPASVLREVLSTPDGSLEEFQQRCEAAFEDRINMLLDLYRFAKSQNDPAWVADIENRLEKVIAFSKLKKEIWDICAR